MLRVFEKRGASGQLNEVSLDKVSLTSTVWIDAQNPTKEELKIISDKTNVQLTELSDYTDTSERPRAHDNDLYSSIVYAYPGAGRSVSAWPVFIFMFGRQGLLTIHAKDIPSMDNMIHHIHENMDVMGSSSSLLHYILDTLTSSFFPYFDVIEGEVDKMEEEILKTESRPSNVSTQKVFHHKRTLIVFHKALVADREVISYIEKGYIKRMTKKEADKFRDIFNDVVQLIDMCDTAREILRGVIETYLATLSNNMNEVMKKLTAYASLVLVPTLISGIYGMNFRYMPELGWITGYPFALALMVLSALILWIFFKRKAWI